jgi:hypothetical protein
LVVLDGFSKVCGYVSCEEDNFWGGNFVPRR